MMEQPSSSGEWRRWGEISIDVTSLWLSAEVNLLWGAGGLCNCQGARQLDSYGFAFLLFDPVSSMQHTDRKMQRQVLSVDLLPWRWMSSGLFLCQMQCASRLVESARTQGLLLGPVNN